jgi:tetratricopeptide (TPR) repeat protein
VGHFWRANPVNFSIAPKLGAGIVHFLGRRPEEAEEAYRWSLSKNPGSEVARLLLGQTLERQGKWDQAIRTYDALAERDPTYENAYYHRACCLVRLGRDEEAIKDCRRAIGAYRKHAAAHVVMGEILLRQGRLDEAGAAVERALEIKPKDPGVRELARQVLVARDRPRPHIVPGGRKR